MTVQDQFCTLEFDAISVCHTWTRKCAQHMYFCLLTRDTYLCVVVCWILAYEKQREKTQALHCGA